MQPNSFGPELPEQPQVPGGTPPSTHINSPHPSQPVTTPQVTGPQQFSAQPYIGAPEPLPARKRRWPKILLIGTVIAVLAGSGGGYAYWNMLNNRPEKVLADALSNTLTDLLARRPTTTVGSLVYESKGDEAFTVTLDFDSKQANDNYETAATLHFEGTSDEISDIDISVKGALIVIDSEELYVKFDNLEKTVQDLAALDPEAQPFIDVLMPLVRKIDGQWIKIDSQSVAEAGLTESEQQVRACSEAFKKLRISPEDKGNIKDIFARHQFAIATEKLPKETAADEESFHYKLDLNEADSIRFTKELVELRSFATVKKDCEIKPEDFDHELDRLKEVESDRDHEDMAEPVIELWVGTENRLPTRLRIALDDKELITTFDTTVKINAGDIKITAPKDSLSFTELWDEYSQLRY